MKLLVKTLAISFAVASWIVATLVLLKTVPIEIFAFWPVACFAAFIGVVVK